MNELNYMLHKIKPIFNNIVLGEIFIGKFELFILYGELKNKNSDIDTFKQVVDIYIENKKFHILSQILINSIYNKEIKKKYIEDTLIITLIIIYINENEEIILKEF